MCTSNACNLHDLLATMWIFLPQITCKNTICAFVSICKTSKTTREISAFNFPWQDNKNQTDCYFFRENHWKIFFQIWFLTARHRDRYNVHTPSIIQSLQEQYSQIFVMINWRDSLEIENKNWGTIKKRVTIYHAKQRGGIS